MGMLRLMPWASPFCRKNRVAVREEQTAERKVPMKKKRMLDGDLDDRIDIKIFILFLLDELRYPLNEAVIAEIVGENGYVGQFDFKECFSELVERGHITVQPSSKKGGEEEYLISPLGHMVASELQGSLHNYIREKTRISALKRLSFYRRGAEEKCSVSRTDDGRYAVRCEIIEKGTSLLDVTVMVLSEAEAEKIRDHFLERPEEACRGILSVLTGKLEYYMN